MAVAHSASVSCTSRTKSCRCVTSELMTLLKRGSLHSDRRSITARVMLFSSNSRMGRTACPISRSAVGVVRCVIARQPALEFPVCVRPPGLRDLVRLRVIEREFEHQAVGIRNIDRAAIAVFQHEGVGRLDAGGGNTLLYGSLRRRVDRKCDVVK